MAASRVISSRYMKGGASTDGAPSRPVGAPGHSTSVAGGAPSRPRAPPSHSASTQRARGPMKATERVSSTTGHTTKSLIADSYVKLIDQHGKYIDFKEKAKDTIFLQNVDISTSKMEDDPIILLSMSILSWL